MHPTVIASAGGSKEKQSEGKKVGCIAKLSFRQVRRTVNSAATVVGCVRIISSTPYSEFNFQHDS